LLKIDFLSAISFPCSLTKQIKNNDAANQSFDKANQSFDKANQSFDKANFKIY